MAFEQRLTRPPESCTCYWVERSTVALRGDEEITVPVWLRLNESLGCPDHWQVRAFPRRPCDSCARPVIECEDERRRGLVVEAESHPEGKLRLRWSPDNSHVIAWRALPTQSKATATLWRPHDCTRRTR